MFTKNYSVFFIVFSILLAIVSIVIAYFLKVSISIVAGINALLFFAFGISLILFEIAYKHFPKYAGFVYMATFIIKLILVIGYLLVLKDSFNTILIGILVGLYFIYLTFNIGLVYKKLSHSTH